MAKNDKKNNGNNKNEQSSRSQGEDYSQGKKSAGSAGTGSHKSGGASGESLPLDDLTYDVIALLHEKSKALEVYEQYLEDAEDNEEIRALFEQINEQDQQHVERLEAALRSLVSSGELSEEEAA